jgi:hypothetical protein
MKFRASRQGAVFFEHPRASADGPGTVTAYIKDAVAATPQ